MSNKLPFFFTLTILTPQKKGTLYQLLFSLTVVVSIVFLKIWIPDIGRYSPILLFSSAIIIAGWYAGLVASITTTLMSAILVSFMFITPFGVLNVNPVFSVSAGLFMVEGFFLSFFVEYTKRVFRVCSTQKQIIDILFDNLSKCAVVVIDNHNRIVQWSPEAQKIFGYKEKEIMGKSFSRICDKKNWYDQKFNLLHVRVISKNVYTAENTVCFQIKILTLLPKKTIEEKPDKLPIPLPISSELPAQQIA